MSTFIKNFHTQFLVDIYFSAPERRSKFRKDEVLLTQDEFNDRLYLVVKGSFRGYARNPDGDELEIFVATPYMFVGVNSFFSTSKTMTNVVALEDSEVAYISYKEAVELAGGTASLAEQFLPVVVNELLYRQQRTHEIAAEREKAFKKLIQSEKMASLGQMAAGIAHELNNAIVVLEKNTKWLGEEMEKFVREHSPEMLPFFKAGIQSGRSLSTGEIRKKQNRLIRSFGLREDQAEKLAETSIGEDELGKLSSDLIPIVDRLANYWEAGATIKDMLIAAQHATHVVKTVKTLGTPHPAEREPVDVNESIRETLTLLQSNVRRIAVELRLGDVEPIHAHTGELIQVWSNIIKNACESVENARTERPQLTITSIQRGESVIVSIRDNGPGIPSDIRDKIFQPNITTKKEGLSFGLGLGLTIVQRIVSSYQGKIQVESEPGSTTFTIQLPTGA
jgi:signal transduction histidine kinase